MKRVYGKQKLITKTNKKSLFLLNLIKEFGKELKMFFQQVFQTLD